MYSNFNDDFPLLQTTVFSTIVTGTQKRITYHSCLTPSEQTMLFPPALAMTRNPDMLGHRSEFKQLSVSRTSPGVY